VRVNNRVLGSIAIATSPLMLLELILGLTGHLPGGEFGAADAVVGLIYLSGFLATLLGLRTLGLTGYRRWTTVLFGLQLALLLLAALQQCLELAQADRASTIFGLADAAWPLSHILMCATGIAMVTARQWTDYRAYLPFLCGLAIPLLIAVQILLGKEAGRITFALLTTAGFGLLGYALRSSSSQQSGQRPYYSSLQAM
jgi:hypothetical protein